MPTDPDAFAVLNRIPVRFGVTFLSPIFQALAVWPDFLVRAWTTYEPLIDTPRYGAALDAIRVPDELSQGLPRISSDNTTLRDYLALQCSLLPELLLLASTWYRAGQGEASSVAAGPTAPRRPVRSAALPTSADPGLDEILADLQSTHEHPRVLSVYRAIGSDAAVLRAAAPTLLARIAAPEYATATAALLDATNAADFGMPAIPLDDEGPLEILALFRTRMIPALILDLTILSAMLEPTGGSR